MSLGDAIGDALVEFAVAWEVACSDRWSGDQSGWLFEDRVSRALKATAEMVTVDALWRLDGINLHDLALEIGNEIKRQDERRETYSVDMRTITRSHGDDHMYEVRDESWSDATVADFMIDVCSRRKQAQRMLAEAAANE